MLMKDTGFETNPVKNARSIRGFDVFSMIKHAFEIGNNNPTKMDPGRK